MIRFLSLLLKRKSFFWNSECLKAARFCYGAIIFPGERLLGLIFVFPKTLSLLTGFTFLKDGRVVTSGGRVLGVTAWAPTLQGARDAAYAAVDPIRFEGMQCRRDIAAKALGRG